VTVTVAGVSHPAGSVHDVEATSVRFAAAVRSLGRAARLRSLVVPGFRSPPGIPGVCRSIRLRGGVPSVAVALKERPWSAVVADMIEGIVVANGLDGAKADRARAALWLAVDDSGELDPLETPRSSGKQRAVRAPASVSGQRSDPVSYSGESERRSA